AAVVRYTGRRASPPLRSAFPSLLIQSPGSSDGPPKEVLVRSSARKQRASTPKRTRSVSVLAVIGAAAALLAVTLSSGQARMTSQRTASPRAATQAPRAQGSVAVRDPENGQLRDATAAELLELQGQAAQETSVPEPIVSAAGLSGLTLGADQ